MGKRKKNWKKVDVEDVEDAVRENNEKGAAALKENDDLFFEDKKGNLDGTGDRKRKQKASGKKGKDKEAWKAVKKVKTGKASKKRKQEEQEEQEQQEQKKQEQAQREQQEREQQEQEAEAKVVATAVVTSGNASRKKQAKLKRAQEGKGDKLALKRDKVVKTELKGKASDAKEVLRDVWAEESKESKLEKLVSWNNGYEVDTTPILNRKRQYQRSRKQREVVAGKTLVKKQGTQVTAAGASFNPVESQRQEALRAALDIDTREEEEKAELKAKLNPDGTHLQGAAPDSDDESELIPSKKTKGRVTKKVRTARLLRAQEEQARLQEKKLKAMNTQIDRLGAVLVGIKKEEKTLSKKRQRVVDLKEIQPDRRAKVSKHDFEDAFPQLVLEEELEDRSLRTVTPSVDLLADQFKAFQGKNVIETRKRVKGLKRRYKMGQYSRNSHKDPNMMWNTRKKS